MSLYTSGIKTGRSRTVTCEGTFYGPATAGTKAGYTIPPPTAFWERFWYYWSRSNGGIDWNGFSISFAAAVSGTGSNAGWPVHNHLAYSVTVNSLAYTGGETHTLTATEGDILVGNTGTGALPDDGSISGAVTGTFLIEFDVEEWFLVTTFTPVGDPWPAAGTDGVLGIYLKFEERVKIGTGVIRISVDTNCGTYSKSFDNAASGYTLPSYAASLRTASNSVGAYPGGDAATVQATCAGISLGYPRSYTFADPGGAIVVDGSHPYNGILLAGTYERGSYTNNSDAGAKTTQHHGWYPANVGASPVGMRITQLPPMTVQVQGLTLDFGGGLYSVPGLQAQWYAGGNTPMNTLFEVPPLTASGGSIFGSKDLKNVQLQGFGPFTGEINFSAYKTFAQLYSLGASGEEPGDIALNGAWRSWNALSIAHAASESVDTCASTTGWAAGANTTVTTSGGAIQLAAAGGVGSATRTYTPAKNSEGYRYLDVKLRSTVNPTITVRVTIGQKYWDIVTVAAGTYVTRSIDLMCPDGTLSALTAQQDSRWPLNHLLTDTPANEGLNWGVNRITTLIVGSIPDGETIELDNISLERKRSATSHFSAAYKPIAGVYELDTGPPTSPVVRRFLLCHTDGRQSQERYESYSTIDALATAINLIPGFTAAGLGGADAYFNSNNLPAYMLAAWGGVLSDVTSYLETDISGGANIKAQFIFDALGFYPGCGDVLGSNSYGGTTILRLAPKVLRGHGHGLVLDTSGLPMSGQTVRLVENPSGLASGQGISDSGGYFHTGYPHGRGGKYFDFVGSPPVTNIRIAPRKKQRIGVGAAGAVTDVDDLQSNQGEHHIVFARDGDLVYRFSVHTETHWKFETAITGDGGWSMPRVCIDARWRLHLLAYQTGTGLCYFESHDNGKTWTDPDLIMADATSGMTRWAKSGGAGLRIIFIPDSGTTGPGKFKSQWTPNPDHAWSTLVTMKDQDGADLHSAGYGWGFDHAAEGPDRWSLTFRPEGDTEVRSYYISDKGQTAKLIT